MIMSGRDRMIPSLALVCPARMPFVLPWIRILFLSMGFHCHIGSQILQLEPFRLAAEVMLKFMSDIRAETGFVARELDIGGGLGIRYREEDQPPSIEAFVENIAGAVRKYAQEYNYPLPELMLEPGRSIAGEAGITLYTVGVVKDVPGVRRFVSVDGGMMDTFAPRFTGQATKQCWQTRLQEPWRRSPLPVKPANPGSAD